MTEQAGTRCRWCRETMVRGATGAVLCPHCDAPPTVPRPREETLPTLPTQAEIDRFLARRCGRGILVAGQVAQCRHREGHAGWHEVPSGDTMHRWRA